ncbi:MAG TPA: glycosyltransferase [Burkholderiaceae bacterium]|nr:glycosyltransferase [Burkholderiaceae bacterium]
MSKSNRSLGIITATYNSAKHLPALISSLRAQTCQDFDWVVADGNSNDGTIELLQQVKDLNLSWVSEHDFGIYDAMNKAIHRCQTEYYVVIGSDDVFNENAVEKILATLQKEPKLDVLVGNVVANGKLIHMPKGNSFIYGARAFVTAHSVGCVFRKQLHEEYGYYSKNFPITADSYFIKTIFANPTLKVQYVDDVFGTFSTGGASNTQVLQCYVEGLHTQLLTEKYPLLQILLFTARYMKLKLTPKKTSR